jgi:hypothetical protein
LQISAPISPGSSGGPVFNLKGEVVAISSFQLSEGQNLNFAIPVDEISKLRDQRANLSLEQVYWQNHLSPSSKAAARTSQSNESQESFPQATFGTLTGSYWGTVHNLTANVSAPFGIFTMNTEGIVWGCMAVQAPLYGSGPLYGNFDGTNVSFSVSSSNFTIVFTGVRDGRQLNGTYTVDRPDGTSEQGEFFLVKKDSKKLADNMNPARDCPTDEEINKE